jgi:Acyclic terpene utilisation family protein AtuA
MTKPKPLRIGGASGFWGDSAVGAPQLVASGQIDVLVFDYLAETTMAILAAMRAKKPELGYATDFVDGAMKAVLPQVMQRGIKVVANAGGINPAGCAAALKALAESMGLAPRIAVVEGDDVLALLPTLRDEGVRDMFSGEPLSAFTAAPARVLSANAYLGAFPVAQALAAGADIVITGRGVDSAVTLGALIHHFGWSATDFDRLAGGSLAGHIIECGCHATGGLFTDWQRVPDWAHIGYPIVECFADGSFELTKPMGTGGLIDRACVAEQLLYEIGDPGAYLLPDVSCDFRSVHIENVARDGAGGAGGGGAWGDGSTGGTDATGAMCATGATGAAGGSEPRVRVSGAKGSAPTSSYKVSATQMNGWCCAGMMVIVGIDAAAKAQRTAHAIIERTGELLAQAGMVGYTRTAIELFGNEALYGPHTRHAAAREVMLRVVVDHPDKRALDIFAREIAPAGTSWSPGTTMPSGGRPVPAPRVLPFAFLLDKTRVPVQVRLGDAQWPCVPAETSVGSNAALAAAVPALPRPATWVDAPGAPLVEVPLIRLAWARSGDKGDWSNIGLIARQPEWLPLLWARVTPQTVAAYFAHLLCDGAAARVERFHLPGIDAMNFVLHGALAGGGPASPRFDPLGKGFGQMLLDMPVLVPASWGL